MGAFENNIYFDPLTAMPSFFKFIESDACSMFGERGSVIIFDMVKFIEINDTFGRDTGDLFLKNFAYNLRNILNSYKDICMFRTHGDEFTVVIKNMGEEEAEELALHIRSEFKGIMRPLGFENADVHTLVISYSETIKSINQYFRMMFKKSLMHRRDRNEKFSEDRLMEGVIGNFTNRIQETLAYLRDAYSLALTDDISTLPNQRAAKLYLKDLIKEEAKAEGFSILFIDGDNLKRYNQISYETGNEMIRALSQVISSSLRKDDRIFRWLSGDEFLVVLGKVGYEDGIRLAERIRASVEEQTRKWLYPITVSIGMASYPEDGSCMQELINRAEKANITAKNSGKNRVVRWMAS